MSGEQGNRRFKNRRSRVLWEITVMVVLVYIVSTNKLITEKAQTIRTYIAKSMGE